MKMVGIPRTRSPSIRHSRARGNPGLFCAELAWIPAFAGMTEPRRLFVVHIIPSHVFSKDDTKSTKFEIEIIQTLRDPRGKNVFTVNPPEPNKKAGLLPRHVAKATGSSPPNSPLNITPRSLHCCSESREIVKVEGILL